MAADKASKIRAEIYPKVDKLGPYAYLQHCCDVDVYIFIYSDTVKRIWI